MDPHLNLRDPEVMRKVLAANVMGNAPKEPDAPKAETPKAEPKPEPKPEELKPRERASSSSIRITLKPGEQAALERDAKALNLSWQEYFRFLISERITGRPIGSTPLVTGPSQISGHARQRIQGPSNQARFQ